MRLSLTPRLLASFALIAAIGTLVAWVGINGLRETKAGMEQVVRTDAALLVLIQEAHIGLLTERRYEKDMFLNSGAEKRQRQYLAKFDMEVKEQEDRLAKIEAAIHGHPGFQDDSGRSLADGLADAHQAFLKALRAVIPQAIGSDMTPQRANGLLEPHKNTIRNLEIRLETLLKTGHAVMDASAARVSAMAESSQERMQWVASAGLLLSLAIGLVLAVSIARPVRYAANRLVMTTTTLSDRAANLARTAKESSTRLTSVATSSKELCGSASTMAASAEEMTAGATTVAASAEQLAGSTNAVATAVEEMIVSIQEISQSATTAATVATKAKELTGTATMVMRTLDEAAGAIGKVTETITGIAAQTNLLALNATIEAARAGEAGRGFAVVASEVKQLAQQAGSAAGDIAQRIATIQGKTAEASRALTDIAVVVEQFSQSSGQTAVAVQEQAATVAEIGRNVSETGSAAKGIAQAIAEVKTGIDEITRNTAQSAAASRDVAGALTTLSQAMESASATSVEVDKAMTEMAGIATRLQRLAGGRTATGS